MAAADPYSVLGVARGATDADIKKAYRKLAKELHPDKNKDNPKASDRFSAVTAAYDLLSDSDKRARFDRGEIDGDGNPAAPFGFGGGGSGGFRPQAGGADFGDIFEDCLEDAPVAVAAASAGVLRPRKRAQTPLTASPFRLRMLPPVVRNGSRWPTARRST